MRKLILIILLAAFGVSALPGETIVNQGSSSSGRTWRIVTKKKHKRHHKRRQRHHRRKHKRQIEKLPTATQTK